MVLKYFFGQGWVGGKIIPRIRLTSAKDQVEVEAELGKNPSNNEPLLFLFDITPEIVLNSKTNYIFVSMLKYCTQYAIYTYHLIIVYLIYGPQVGVDIHLGGRVYSAGICKAGF